MQTEPKKATEAKRLHNYVITIIARIEKELRKYVLLKSQWSSRYRKVNILVFSVFVQVC